MVTSYLHYLEDLLLTLYHSTTVGTKVQGVEWGHLIELIHVQIKMKHG
jgi:hypothetical protein